jgi:hypothetical protein
MRGRALPLIVATIVTGLVLGGAISVLAFYVARYGPSGGNWSFKGNGALAVYAAFPPVMAAGWTALVLHARVRSWLWPGIGVGLIGLVIAAVQAALLPVFGSTADMIGSPIALLALLAWTVGAPVAAILVRATSPVQSVATHLVAGGLWFVAAAVGLVAVGILVPAGS